MSLYFDFARYVCSPRILIHQNNPDIVDIGRRRAKVTARVLVELASYSAHVKLTAAPENE